MKEITINTENFDLIDYMSIKFLHGDFGYVTKAKDRDGNNGILLFIPTLSDNHSNELIDNLGD